jgi:UDPglucose 6-dehydrogenase
VGTPQDEDGSADLTHVLEVARGVARAMNGYKILVNKSTVPVGTSVKVREVVSGLTKHHFAVVSNPEFLKEGTAVDDFLKPDRVVIGTDDPEVEAVMRQLYEPFVRTGKPILVMDPASAELTKYAANAMLATRISFMNEIANVCDKVGANIDSVRRGIGSDERIGSRFLFAGVGYGGSCFPKDVKAIIHTAEDAGYDFRIVKAVEAVNETQKRVLFEQVSEHFGADLSGRRFAVWGLAFKPNTDDMREAPALVLIEALLAAGATVVAHDPEAMDEARRLYLGDRIEYASNPLSALEDADALILVTEWNEFRRPDFDVVKRALKQPVIFDGRNVWPRRTLIEAGFTYRGIGR